MLLFHLAKKLGLTSCFRCGTEIENLKDFSIEHKKEWETSETPVELFFDLDNIAFSHTLCNLKAAKRKKVYATSEEMQVARYAREKAVPGKYVDKLKRKREAYHKRNGSIV